MAHTHVESHAIADRRTRNRMHAHEHMQPSVRRGTHTGKYRRMCARAHPHTNAAAHVRWIEVAHKSVLLRWIHAYVSSARVNADAHARGRATQASQQASNNTQHSHTHTNSSMYRRMHVRSRLSIFSNAHTTWNVCSCAARVCPSSCILVAILCFCLRLSVLCL